MVLGLLLPFIGWRGATLEEGSRQSKKTSKRSLIRVPASSLPFLRIPPSLSLGSRGSLSRIIFLVSHVSLRPNSQCSLRRTRLCLTSISSMSEFDPH